jgi:putative spermidine/putrescine transport system permease protein
VSRFTTPLYRIRQRAGHVLILAIAFLFLLGPIAFVAVASFDPGTRPQPGLATQHFTLNAYLKIPPRYYDALLLSTQLALACAACACLIGIPAALGLVRGKMRGKAVLLALLRMPLQIPGVVSGLAFLQAYYVVGDLTGWYPTGSFWGMLAAHVFAATPYVIGTLVALLQRFDASLEEASLSLGATTWATFMQVTLPLLKPGLFTGALYAFMISFVEVPISVFLVGSGRATFPVEIFNALQFDFEPSVLAVSTLVTLLSLAVVLLVQKVLGLDVFVKVAGAD